MEQEFRKTRLDLVEESTQSVWNVCISFDTWKEHLKLSTIEERNVVLNGKQFWEKIM